MVLDEPVRQWTIDMAARQASCGSDVVRFDRLSDYAFDIAFIAGGECSLEEQCLIAGEAAAAIRAKIGTR